MYVCILYLKQNRNWTAEKIWAVTVKILTHVSFYLILSMYLDSWDGFYPKENITNLLQLSFRMFVCLDFLHMPLFSLIIFNGAKLGVAPVARAPPLFLPRPEIKYIYVLYFSAPPWTYLVHAPPPLRPNWRHW